MNRSIEDDEANIDKFIHHLSTAISVRLMNANDKGIAILFSGGVDSLLMAVIADRVLDLQIPIDLINVAFDRDGGDFRVPDRITGISAYRTLIDATPNRQWRFIEVNVDRTELQTYRQTSIRRLLLPANTVLDDSIGCVLWFGARGVGRLHSNGMSFK